MEVANRQVQFRELFPSCQFIADVIQRRIWLLLQMGDSVHRQFVVSVNSDLPVSFENWHYLGSPVRVAHWLNHLRLHQPVQFFLYLDIILTGATKAQNLDTLDMVLGRQGCGSRGRNTYFSQTRLCTWDTGLTNMDYIQCKIRWRPF